MGHIVILILKIIYKIQSLLCWLAFRDTGYEIMKWDLDKKYNELLGELKLDLKPTWRIKTK